MDKEKKENTTCDCSDCACEDCKCEKCKLSCKDCKCEECDCKECDCKGCDCKDCEDCKCEKCKLSCKDCKCEECDCKDCECEKCDCDDCECGDCEECESCEDCEDLLKQLEAEKNKNLATLADFVNYRKRSEKEKSELSVIANQILLQNIIEIIDDFDRALNDEKMTKEGIELIYKKFTNVLEQYNLKEIKVKKGDKFDPETMEAVTAIHTQNDKEKGTVMDILSKGYLNSKNGQVYKTIKVITGK